MPRLLRLLPGLFLAGLFLPAAAQTTVQGTVTDPDGLPLPGASVVIEGSTSGAATDFDGRYQFVSERTGEVTLVASYVGFAPERRLVTLAGTAITADFQLDADALGLSEVFVTGVANPVSKIESSVSITTVEDQAIALVAPRTTAEVFRTVPGIRVEASGGDGNTNITVRGVPISAGGSKYLQLQEDGLPIFLYGDMAFATSDIFLRNDATLARIEAIRGGSASTLASNSPAGLINFISETGAQEGGVVQISQGVDFDQRRVDFAYGSPFGDDLAFHVGGFYRSGEGPRGPGYVAQQGGQIKASLSKFFDAGYVRVYGKLLDDRTPAYLPHPMRVTGSDSDPSYESANSLSPNGDVIGSPRFLSNFGLGADGQRRRVNLSDGMRPVTRSVGIEASFELASGLTFENRGRFALNSGRFVSPFTAVVGSPDAVLTGGGRFGLFDDDGDPTTPLVTDGGLDDATGRDLSDVILGYADGGQLIPGDTTSSVEVFSGDLVQGIVLFDTELKNFNTLFNDARLTFDFADVLGDTEVGAQLTAGLFTGVQRVNMAWLWNSYLMEVEGEDARLLDIYNAADSTAYSADGLVGYGATFFGNCCGIEFDATYDVKAPYASLALQPLPGLSLDGSVRYDYGSVTGVGSGGTTGPLDVNNDGVIAPVEEQVNHADLAQRNPVDYTYDYWSYSAGANYAFGQGDGLAGSFLDGAALFARYSNGYSAKADRAIFPEGTYVGASSLGIDEPFDRLQQAELGYKQQFRYGGLFVTGFYAQTTEQGGFEATTQEVIDNDYEAFGVEVEGVVDVQMVNVRAGLTYTDAEIKSGANAGKTPRRQPTLLFSIAPSVTTRYGTVGLSVLGQTDAYAQDNNELVMPGYVLLNALVSVPVSEGLSLGVSANNLLDSVGITEVEEGAIPGSGYVRARSVTGRSISASLRYTF